MSKSKKLIESKKTVQISVNTHIAVREFCKREGLKLNWWVDKTLCEKIKNV